MRRLHFDKETHELANQAHTLLHDPAYRKLLRHLREQLRATPQFARVQIPAGATSAEHAFFSLGQSSVLDYLDELATMRAEAPEEDEDG